MRIELIKLQAPGLQFYEKRDSSTGVFKLFLRSFLNAISYKTPPVAVCVFLMTITVLPKYFLVQEQLIKDFDFSLASLFLEKFQEKLKNEYNLTMKKTLLLTFCRLCIRCFIGNIIFVLYKITVTFFVVIKI